MDRAGGYDSYLSLLDDALAYEDVLIVLAGESESRRIRELEERASGR